MTEKIKALVVKHWEVFSYLFFGVLTTVVNYVVFAIAAQVFPDSATVCNVIAWVVAVAFAYLTNKPFVFRSHDWSAKTVVPELGKFLSCRIGSGVMETGISLVAVDILGGNKYLWKLLTNVLVVIVNYIGSKLLVFRKK